MHHIKMNHVIHEWVMSHMNESCHIWMSHVTNEWVMSHMNESCHIWISHVTYEWAMSVHVTYWGVMSHINETCHMWICHVTYEWVTSHAYVTRPIHIWMSHVMYKWVMSHTSHSFDMSHSCHAHLYMHTPLTEKIRLKIFRSRDLTILSLDLLSDGDSVYTGWILCENLGTPVKTCWISKGTPVKTFFLLDLEIWIFRSRDVTILSLDFWSATQMK